ncbi:23S rRNA (pseudouridine(1915)-N(3))-methyltransferase RlmH [Kiritimatiellaeota bacterium B1221]|nr:23S rRNA (pseudouridine(1915)-N(3))-methyltransferase RlmH [Kiritimatiellaeota bacterium B1221]
MKWKIISVGKPSFSWAREGIDTYVKRLQPFAPVEMIQLKKSDSALFLKASGSALTLALDERGRGFTTAAMARQVTTWEMDAVKEVAVFIGGSDGLPAEIRKGADMCFHLGPQTMMHELALLVWMEQLYRVYTLKADHPYHRG